MQQKIIRRIAKRTITRKLAFILSAAIFWTGIVPGAECAVKAAEYRTGTVAYASYGDEVSGIVIDLGEEESESGNSMKPFRYGGTEEQFYNSDEIHFGSALNKQMENYLTGENGLAAKVETLTEEEISNFESRNYSGIQTKATFDLSAEFIECTDNGKELMRWMHQALGRYPNFCAFFTAIAHTSFSKDSKKYYKKVIIYSPVAKEEIKYIIAKYKKKMEQLEKEAMEESSMTDAEKLLSIHDKLIVMAEYSSVAGSGMVNTNYYIPTATVLNGEGVCQSYSAVMGQAITDLGLETVQVEGENHIWNAVQLGDKWYYIDVTWDDPTNQDRDWVSHQYFLTSNDEKHTLDADSEKIYGSILSNMGTAYNNFLPKKNNVKTQMCFWNGTWYYARNGYVYQWPQGGTSASIFTGISYDSTRACGVLDGNLYYSGSGGIYQYQKNREDILLKRVKTKSMIVPGTTFYFLSERAVWEPFVLKEEEPIVLPTPKASRKPITNPTDRPTISTIVCPTISPTNRLTASPTVSLRVSPTISPTVSLRVSPTISPAVSLRVSPTVSPTADPTIYPTTGAIAPAKTTSPPSQHIRYPTPQKPAPAEEFYYDILEDGVHISWYYGDDPIVVVPDEIEGYPVVAVNGLVDESDMIEEVYLPESVKKISHDLFKYYQNLRVVNMGGVCTNLNDRLVFLGCKSLEVFMTGDTASFSMKYMSGNTVEQICRTELDNLKYIYIGDSMQDVAVNLFYGNSLEFVEIGAGNQQYKSVDGIVYSKDGKDLLVCPTSYSCEEVVIPDGTERIDSIAFQYCKAIKKIQIPETVTEIGGFYGITPTIVARENSPADLYAREKGLPVEYYGLALPAPSVNPSPALPVPSVSPSPAPVSDVAESPIPIVSSSVSPSMTAIPTEDAQRTWEPVYTISPKVTQKPFMAEENSKDLYTEEKSRETVDVPAKPVIKSLKNLKGRKVKVTLKAKIPGAVGYQVQYAYKKSFRGARSVITRKRAVSIKKLKKKKICYIRVRAYTMDGTKKVYSVWSKVKKVRVKK